MAGRARESGTYYAIENVACNHFPLGDLVFWRSETGRDWGKDSVEIGRLGPD
jgi:hypothetical protein